MSRCSNVYPYFVHHYWECYRSLTSNVTKKRGFCSSTLHTSLPWFCKPPNSGNNLSRSVYFLGSGKGSKIIILLMIKPINAGGGISSPGFSNICNIRMKNTMLDKVVIRKVGGGGGSPSTDAGWTQSTCITLIRKLVSYIQTSVQTMLLGHNQIFIIIKHRHYFHKKMFKVVSEY